MHRQELRRVLVNPAAHQYGHCTAPPAAEEGMAKLQCQQMRQGQSNQLQLSHPVLVQPSASS
jgi:hypothetical protein